MAGLGQESIVPIEEIQGKDRTLFGQDEFWWRRCVVTLIAIAWGGMLFLCTVENHSRVGRVGFTISAIILLAFGVWKKWFPVGHLRPFILPLSAVYITSLIACFCSLSPAYSFYTFFQHHLWYGIIFLAVGCWARTPRRQRSFLWGLVVAGILSSLAGIILFYFAEGLAEKGLIGKVSDYIHFTPVPGGGVKLRAQGLMQSVTRSALIYIFVLPAAFTLLVHSFRKKRFFSLTLCSLCMMLGGWYLLLTGARGAWVATGFSLSLTCLVIGLSGRVLTVGVLLVGTVCLVSSSPRDRILTFVYNINSPDVLLSKRITLWKQAEEPLLNHLWTGVGYGGNIFLTDEVHEMYPLQTGKTRQPDLHSLYFQTIAEVGILGLLSYGWLVLTLLYYGWRRNFKDGSLVFTPGLIFGLPVLMSILLVGTVYYLNEGLIAQITAACLGLIPAASQRPKDKF